MSSRAVNSLQAVSCLPQPWLPPFRKKQFLAIQRKLCCRRQPPSIQPAAHSHLDDQGGHNGVCVDQAGDAQVLQARGVKDLGARVEPSNVVCALQQLWHDAAERSQHGPARVDDLDLAVPGKGLRVGRQAGGVPAVVTGELAWTQRTQGKRRLEEVWQARLKLLKWKGRLQARQSHITSCCLTLERRSPFR